MTEDGRQRDLRPQVIREYVDTLYGGRKDKFENSMIREFVAGESGKLFNRGKMPLPQNIKLALFGACGLEFSV
jgi:hypothetical protein